MTAKRRVRPRRGRIGGLAATTLLAFVGHNTPLRAAEVTDWLDVVGVVSAAGQCQQLTETAGANNDCRSALPAELGVSIRPSDRDEVFVKLGFTAGNGLNNISPSRSSEVSLTVSGLPGMVSQRILALGASTPWKRMRSSLGRGTRRPAEIAVGSEDD